MSTSVVRRGWRALAAVLPQWVAARIIVLGALGVAHLVVEHSHASPARLFRVHQGLLGWDAGWYQEIARFGYAPLGHDALRFFPLYPLAGRLLAVLPGVSAGTALLLVANVGALVATALLRLLVQRETGDQALANRAVWLLSLAPPAFVLVMGYAEALLLCLAIGCFLAFRRAERPAWWPAALLGYGAALCRPLGVVLVVPVAIEAVRRWRSSRGRVAPVVAVLAPVAGMGTFLAWSQATFGNGWLPLKVQTETTHHGLSDPLVTLGHDATGVLHHHFGTSVHVLWAVVVLVLLVVCWLRLPVSYSAFATAVVLVAVSGTNLDSFERYAWSAFPLAIGASTLLGRRWLRRGVYVLAAAGLGAYATMAFLNILVP